MRNGWRSCCAGRGHSPLCSRGKPSGGGENTRGEPTPGAAPRPRGSLARRRGGRLSSAEHVLGGLLICPSLITNFLSTLLWAAGVTVSPLARTLGVPLDRAGRVLVEPDLTIKEHPEVFAIGDLAALVDPGTGQPLPGVATVAIQQGRATADNLWRACRGQPLVPFRYKERGSLATIGRARAVADLGRLQFTGFVAWVLWLVVHLYFLIGFEDRILVMIQWAWAYLTLQRGARLITHEQRRERRAL